MNLPRSAAPLGAALLLAAWPVIVPARGTQTALAPDAVRAIDAVFSSYDSRVSPGCATAVVRGGAIVFEKGYGMSDFQHDVPITPASIFHVASISKQFAAMSIVLLARDGLLGLDDDVRKHVPEVPDLGHTITLRHLIHHTSGLRDQWQLLGLSGWRADDPKSEEDILWLVSRQRALNFQPGAEHLYSNTGYTLLGTVVRRVTGKSLREFTEERIFGPLGMTSTHFHDDHSMIVPGRTSAYAPRRGGGPANIDDYRISIPVFDNAGATSLFTTVRDMAKWEANFLSPVVGDVDVLAQIHERGRLNDGTEIPYAFALVHDTHRGLRTIGHSGSDAGYRADFLRFPDERHAFVTFCNVATANPGLLNRRVAEIVLADRLAPAPAASGAAADPAEVPLPRPALEALAGAYLDPRTDTLRQVVFRPDTSALHAGPGANASRLIHTGDHVFAVAGEPGSRLRFMLAGAQYEAAIGLVEVGRSLTLDRMRSPDATPGRLKELAGRYRSEELDVDWAIVSGDAGPLVLQRRRLADQPMQPVYEDGFSAGAGSLRFTRDGAGRVDGFLLTSGRVRHIRFDRQR